MSWFAATKPEVTPLSADEIVFSNFNFTGQPDVPEAEESFLHAVEAARKIADSGIVGNPAVKRFNVSVSGHANPGNVPAEGWVNDCVSISISQASDL